MQIKFTLEDTSEWMRSDDYKVRLKAEYWQLVIRMEKARNAAVHFLNPDSPDVTTRSRVEDLLEQFEIMKKYKRLLEKRARYEHADLDNVDVVFWW